MTTELKTRRLPAYFAPETRFDTIPLANAPFRATEPTELDRLKERLLKLMLVETQDVELYAPLRRAANDAAALAWTTAYPLLVLPVLFEEKARDARLRVARQAYIRVRTQTLMVQAA